MKYFFKKNIISFIVAIALICIPFIASFIVNKNYQQTDFEINNYKIDAAILEDGGLDIIETIDVTFDKGTDGAFYRDIVIDKNNNGVSTNTADFITDNVSLAIYTNKNSQGEKLKIFDSGDGTNNSVIPVQYGTSWNRDKDDLNQLIEFPSSDYDGANGVTIFSYFAAGLSQNRTYVFKYHYDGAVTTYNDVSELNWCFWSGSVEASNIEVNITFPHDYHTEDIYFYGHASDGTLKSIEETGVSYTIDKLKPTQKVEQRIIFPALSKNKVLSKNYLDLNGKEYLENEELAIAQADAKIHNINVLLFILGILLLILNVVIGIVAFFAFDKEKKSDFDSDYYRELPGDYPPLEMGYLYNFKDISKNDVSATLMDLIRRGYVSIEYANESLTKKDANYVMKLDKSKDPDELTKYERYLLQWFFIKIGKNGTLSLNDLDKYCKNGKTAEKYIHYNERFVELAKREASKRDFFNDKAEKKAKAFVVIPVIVLFIGFIYFFMGLSGNYPYALYICGFFNGSCAILISYLLHIKRRSTKGNEDFIRWKAFKNFLSEFSHFEDYPMPSIKVWEHYLVYAVSFGIADLVNKQLRFKFKDKLPTGYSSSPFYRYDHGNFYFTYYFTRRIYNTHTIANNTYTAMKAKQAANTVGGGGRGGFGGGSSFGGGGGGARGR